VLNISSNIIPAVRRLGGFSPSDLATADRTLLSWWDARDTSRITEVTGVSEIQSGSDDGNDFVQATPSAQPLLSGSGSSSVITYDGINDHIKQPVTAGNFQDLTRFEWWSCVYVDSVVTKRVFAFEDEGGSTSNRASGTTLPTTNQFRMLSANNALTSYITTDNGFANGYHVVGYVYDGLAGKIYINNIDEPVTDNGKTNSGVFVGGLTNKTLVDILSIGAKLSTTANYGDNKQKYDLCFGGTTDAALSTAAERTNIFNYINSAVNLGL
jgi:hypothetical protein